MSHNYNDLFTYERIEYATESTEENVCYHDCVMLQTVGEATKGTHVDTIATTIQIMGWNDDDLIFDEVFIDERHEPTEE